MCDMLKRGFPSIDVDMDAIFVQQGNVWTSAGVSAGIDLALLGRLLQALAAGGRSRLLTTCLYLALSFAKGRDRRARAGAAIWQI